jgi:hypothetical protein
LRCLSLLAHCPHTHRVVAAADRQHCTDQSSLQLDIISWIDISPGQIPPFMHRKGSVGVVPALPQESRNAGEETLSLVP